ncbi:MAG: hypothetical protein ACKO6N_06525 [Myxococcota bacterium]
MVQPLRKNDPELEELDQDDVVDDLEEMTPEEEAELMAELEESVAAAARGEFVDADEVLAELKAETDRWVAAHR